MRTNFLGGGGRGVALGSGVFNIFFSKGADLSLQTDEGLCLGFAGA